MANLFIALYDKINNNKTISIVLFFLIIFISILSISKILVFKNDIWSVIPESKETIILKEITKNTPSSNNLTIIVNNTRKSETPTDLVNYSTSLTKEINTALSNRGIRIPEQFNTDKFTVLFEIINEHLPIFIDTSDYTIVDSLISLDALNNKMFDNYNKLTSPASQFYKNQIRVDPIGLSDIALKKIITFLNDENLKVQEGLLIAADNNTALYNFSVKDHLSNINTIILVIQEIIHKYNTSNKNYEILLFGSPLVAFDNAQQIKKDTTLTLSLTIILLIILYFIYFRSIIKPIIILLPSLFGILCGLIGFTLLKDEISLITIGTGSIVLSISISFGLHYMIQYNKSKSIEETLKYISFPLIIGSTTTIVGFLFLTQIESPLLQELGLFAALCIFGSTIGTLIILPHFKQWSQIKNTSKLFDRSFQMPDKLGNRIFAFIILLTPVMIYFASKIKFDEKIENLNYVNNNTRKADIFLQKLSKNFTPSNLTYETDTNLDKLLSNNEILKSKFIQDKNTIIDINSSKFFSDILPSETTQKNRIKYWQNYWSDEKIEELSIKLTKTGIQYNFNTNLFNNYIESLKNKDNLLTEDQSNTFIDNFLSNYIIRDNNKYHATSLIYEHINSNLTSNNITKSVNNAIIYNRKSITNYLVDTIENEFNKITLITSLLVFLSLLISYGRIEIALISFIPMIITWVWILGIMTLVNIEFNIVNIILSTLIFALGDDFCIFTTDKLENSYSKKTNENSTTFQSITLTAITIIIGIGILSFAKHPALKSISAVAVIGISMLWINTQIIQPKIYKWLILNPTKDNHPPYTLLGILKSIFSFSYFVIGSIILTIIGFVIVYIPFGSKNKRKYLYHKLIQSYAKSVIYIMTNVKKKVKYISDEDFSKSSIIIANHSSVLDILSILMIHPKIILVTNKWVYNSPIFGWLVRMADFQYIKDDLTNNSQAFKKLTEQGYHIAIFPEGTRSKNGKIGRFHKGATYLSNELKLDILPIYIHNAHNIIRKGYFYLNDGTFGITIGKRIPYHSTNNEIELKDKNKSISQIFKSNHTELDSVQQDSYNLYKCIISNYIYKGPVIEHYSKIKIKLEEYYNLYQTLIPLKVTVLDIGCGYGHLDYFLALSSSSRYITGVDYDEDKISIAINNYIKPENLEFINSDILNFTFSTYDVIILNDILHYLDQEQQEKIIKKSLNALNNNGFILIREGISDAKSKHKITKLTEFFSIRLLKFNKSKNRNPQFNSQIWYESLGSKYNAKIEIIQKYTWNSNIIIKIEKN